MATQASSQAFCAGADLGGGAKTFDYAKQDADPREANKVNGVYRDGGGLVTLRSEYPAADGSARLLLELADGQILGEGVAIMQYVADSLTPGALPAAGTLNRARQIVGQSA